MIVVDSSVLIDWLRNTATPQTGHLDRMAGQQLVLLGDLIVLEVLQGARSEADATRLEQRLEVFDVASMVNMHVAREAARNFRVLRRLGITIRKQIDLLIGTFCIAHGHELLHADRDFEPMQHHLGLRVAGGHDPLH